MRHLAEGSPRITLGLIFLTCFFDVIGFSMIIPLMPYQMDFYLGEGASGSFLTRATVSLIDFLSGGKADATFAGLFFGGLMAFLFAIFQFLSAPFWGAASDRFGRRPMLLLTVALTCVAHAVWMFGGTIEVFLLARVLTGMMAGNISVATAAVADVTSSEGRARGMTAVGLAYSMGFIAGPVLGGFFGSVNLLQYWSDAPALGLHPFSIAAASTLLLSLVNLVGLFYCFPETLKEADRVPRMARIAETGRSIFVGAPSRSIRLMSSVFFVFLLVYAGVEFGIAFLASDRFNLDVLETSLLYGGMGISQLISQFVVLPRLVQWGSERRTAMMGLVLTALGIAGTGLAQFPAFFAFSLITMAFGGGLVFPTVMALASLMVERNEQGAMLGLFRSRGDLGQAFGPLLVSLTMLALSGYAFLVFALLLCLPLRWLDDLRSKKKRALAEAG
ncbi:MAG: MFS transporter [Opitutales bacterium]